MSTIIINGQAYPLAQTLEEHRTNLAVFGVSAMQTPEGGIVDEFTLDLANGSRPIGVDMENTGWTTAEVQRLSEAGWGESQPVWQAWGRGPGMQALEDVRRLQAHYAHGRLWFAANDVMIWDEATPGEPAPEVDYARELAEDATFTEALAALEAAKARRAER